MGLPEQKQKSFVSYHHELKYKKFSWMPHIILLLNPVKLQRNLRLVSSLNNFLTSSYTRFNSPVH